MGISEIIDHLPPRQDLVRFARYVASLRRPARGKLLFYGVAGVLIGAGVALLLAPTRGSELRSAIGGRFDDYMRQPDEVVTNGHDTSERH